MKWAPQGSRRRDPPGPAGQWGPRKVPQRLRGRVNGEGLQSDHPGRMCLTPRGHQEGWGRPQSRRAAALTPSEEDLGAQLGEEGQGQIRRRAPDHPGGRDQGTRAVSRLCHYTLPRAISGSPLRRRSHQWEAAATSAVTVRCRTGRQGSSPLTVGCPPCSGGA